MGRGGKLDINIDKVRLTDGSKTLLNAVKNTKGGGHTGAMTGAIVATSLVVWPAAPFFLFMHGKDITIPKGTAITAFVQGDDVLDRAKFTGQAKATSATAPAPRSPVAQVPAVQAQAMNTDASVADAARQNRARKNQSQTQSQDQSQEPQQQDPNQ